MIFNVEIHDHKESNIFLRRLWAELRGEFGKCAWNYRPHRIGEATTIVFGMMDIGIPEGTLQVGIFYLKKGTIKTINFDFIGKSPSENRINEIKQSIQAIIFRIKRNFNKPSKFVLEVGISGIVFPLGYYKGEAFLTHLSQGNKFKLAIETTGYDEIDAQTEFQRKTLKFLDLLSVETNSSFWCDALVDGADQDANNEEIIMQDLEWIDDYPVINKKLRLSKTGKKLLDLIAKDQLNEAQELFLRACNHFHTARKYDAQVYDRLKYHSTEEVESGLYEINFEERDERLSMAAKMGSTHMEIASVFYISALEVASSIDIEDKNCPQCGQKVYGHRRRIADMVDKYLNVHLAKEFKGYYDQRSKYLHTGELLSNYSYIGTTIPQLDVSDPTGCKVHSGIPLLNLREYTSFCLRKVLQSLTADSVEENVVSEQ